MIKANVQGFGDVAVFENRQPVTSTEFITKSSLFILLPGVIRLELKLISEQKVENIYSSPGHIAKPPVSGYLIFRTQF